MTLFIFAKGYDYQEKHFSYCHVSTFDSFAKRFENKQDEFNWLIGIYWNSTM